MLFTLNILLYYSMVHMASCLEVSVSVSIYGLTVDHHLCTLFSNDIYDIQNSSRHLKGAGRAMHGLIIILKCKVLP